MTIEQEQPLPVFRPRRVADLAQAGQMRTGVLELSAQDALAPQTKRTLFLLAQVGVRHLIVAVSDTEDTPAGRETLERIELEWRGWGEQLGIEITAALPLAMLERLNVDGSLAGHGSDSPEASAAIAAVAAEIETARERREQLPLRVVVTASRQESGGSRVLGKLVSGRLRPGDRVRIQPMGKETRVAAVQAEAGSGAQANAGQPVELTLADALAIAEGSVISTFESPASVADQFEATVLWLHPEPLLPSRRYQARIGEQTADLTVTDIKYELAVGTGEHLAANRLREDGVGVCNISLSGPIAFDAYRDNPATGMVRILDRDTGADLGLALLHFALRRAENIHIQHVDIDKGARAAQKTQNPCVVWFTGLSGSGKSTIANHVEQQLYQMGHHTYLLDGDNVRHGLNRDLGFTEVDRVENIRRVGEVAKLMVDAGLIVLTAFISPFRTERQMARDLLSDGEFLEVFVDVPLDIAEQRDPKGLYRKARRGELKNFTGIDSPYEAPENPELIVDTASVSAQAAAAQVIQALRVRGRLPPSRA